jgi:hypothetical protein
VTVSLDNWLSILLGVVSLAGGVALIRFRVTVAKFFTTIYLSSNTAIAQRTAQSSKPSVMLAVGIVWALIGVGSLAMGIFHHTWS